MQRRNRSKLYKIKKLFIITNNMGTASKKGKYRASLSLEAALVMPLFIYGVMMLVSIIMYIGIMVRVQLALYNTAEYISKYYYAYEVIKYEKNVSLEELENTNILTKLLGQGMEMVTVKGLVLAELGTEFEQEDYIKGGAKSMKFYYSEIVNDDGIIDLVVTYTLSSPFDIFNIGNIRTEQRAKVRGFKGDVSPESIENAKAEEEQRDITYVYITESGTVYHTNKACTYLKIKLQEVTIAEVGNERSEDGSKYYPCNKCARNTKETELVFITKYGTRYHTNKNCYEIKRGIIKVDIEEVEDRRCCSKCEGE